MVEFDIKINAEQRSAYIPQEIFAVLGTRVKAVPNRAAVVLFGENLSLTDVVKSINIIKADIQHRIEMTRREDERTRADSGCHGRARAEAKTVSGDMNQQLKLKDARIAQYAWKCKLRGLKENTIERRCYLLQRLVTDGADLNQPATVDTALAVKNYPTPTKWLMVNTYRTYCKAYHIDWEPVRVKYKAGIPEVLTETECMLYLAAMPKKLMVFCRVLFETGCRSGEAVQIEWQDINTENLTIRIAHPEKGSDERTVKVTRELMLMIDSLPRKYGTHVFNPYLRTWQSCYETYRKKIATKLNKPKLLKIHFHSFRRMRGTLDIMNGINVYEVKDKLGHRCICNTDKYVHWAKQLKPDKDDRYYTKTVASDEDTDALIEAGWTFVCVNPITQRLPFRKAK